MFEFWRLRYLMGKITAQQLQSLVPSHITQAQCNEILSAATAAESEDKHAI